MYKVLVANRGEIAIRILRSAGELGWTTVAIYTNGDESHATFAHESVKLDNSSDYLNVEKIVEIAVGSKCTHLHPGYGFLSESATLAHALLSLTDNPITFVGPSVDTLRISSNKQLSRDLAQSLGVSVAAGAEVSNSEDVRSFARQEGFPVMLKALHGGGGRGIRMVESDEGVEDAFGRCLGESSSKQLFVEKAMTGPFWKHIEVQIVGDGSGAVVHLWERECSVQRRFQKIIEVAPSGLPAAAIEPLLGSSLKIAQKLNYRGLGTFEYLINSRTLDWIFLEINPRVQVEHTVTEEVTGIDLVRTQLLLFTSSTTLKSLSLSYPPPPPKSHSIQLRLTAEDPSHSFRLSPGTLKHRDIIWPSGPGIRIDTWLSTGPFTAVEEHSEFDEWNVSTDFDSLLAKVIIRAQTFDEASQKARYAMLGLRIGGPVTTNREVLAGVLHHKDWLAGIDTLWLERNISEVLQVEKSVLKPTHATSLRKTADGNGRKTTNTQNPSQGILLQPGASFHLVLSSSSNSYTSPMPHTLVLSSVSHNTFPDRLSGVLKTSFAPSAFNFSLSQSSSVAVGTTEYELANLHDASHVASPLTGKIVELHPALVSATDESATATENSREFIREGETLAIFSVMKMESVVMNPRDAFVERRGKGVQVGAVLKEGSLVCVLINSQKPVSSRL